jgi:hypothetical protein
MRILAATHQNCNYSWKECCQVDYFMDMCYSGAPDENYVSGFLFQGQKNHQVEMSFHWHKN